MFSPPGLWFFAAKTCFLSPIVAQSVQTDRFPIRLRIDSDCLGKQFREILFHRIDARYGNSNIICR